MYFSMQNFPSSAEGVKCRRRGTHRTWRWRGGSTFCTVHLHAAEASLPACCTLLPPWAIATKLPTVSARYSTHSTVDKPAKPSVSESGIISLKSELFGQPANSAGSNGSGGRHWDRPLQRSCRKRIIWRALGALGNIGEPSSPAAGNTKTMFTIVSGAHPKSVLRCTHLPWIPPLPMLSMTHRLFATCSSPTPVAVALAC